MKIYQVAFLLFGAAYLAWYGQLVWAAFLGVAAVVGLIVRLNSKRRR